MATTEASAGPGDGNDDAASSVAASTLLEAIASTEMEASTTTTSDIENQRCKQPASPRNNDVDDETPAPSEEKPLPDDPTDATTMPTIDPNVGILAGDDDDETDTASVFSFDSYERRPRIPLRVQNMIRKQQQQQRQHNYSNDDTNNRSAVPFPSVANASMEGGTGGGQQRMAMMNGAHECPCRCLFFTLKETVCMIMSLLGCLIFLVGLILLCMYLEGSIFNINNER